MDKSWKSFENRICKMFGGKRRGADYGDVFGGKNDCLDTKGWSIECKLWQRPSFAELERDCRKAEARKETPLDIPLAIMKRKGKGIPDKDALVAMRLETFLEYFVR
jgi:hypothetical protein